MERRKMETAFTQQEITLLIANKIIPASADKAQVAYFFEVCKRKHLDPFLKHVHMIERNERDPKNEGKWIKSYTIQTSLDGMRAIAQRNVKIISYRRTVKRVGDETYGCCEIATADRGAYYDEVPLSEYIGRTKTGEVTKFWKQFPQTMIKKVAEESVLRMLCPEDLSGIYGDDEMNQADNQLTPSKETKQITAGEPLDDSFLADIQEPLPQTTAQSASFNQFDPQKEIMTFGKKHNGVEWVHVPDSYLEWMSEAATGENQTKAKLTLEFKKNISKQVPDPLDDVFGKQESLIPPDELTLVEKLQYNLEDVVNKSGTVEALEGWKKINQSDIDKLPAGEKATLKKIYTNAIAKAKKA
jgi:phage recombination protein Bet